MSGQGFSIQPQANRFWLPSDFLDDTVPSARPTPDAWLFRLDDGAHRYGDKDGEGWGSFSVSEGQIVNFCPRDDYPDATLTINADGSWSLSPEPPAGATLYLPFDILADSPEDLVNQARDGLVYEDDKTGEYEVRVYVWGDGIDLRFTALDGPPRFVLPVSDGIANANSEAAL